MLYTIRGVKVDFPYDAYECQLVYMEKVIQALQEGRNALLESPTGTGKTLCLLCSTLAWRQSYIDQQKVAADETSTQFSEPPVTIIYASRTHSQLTQVVRELKRTSYRIKTSILGSRAQMCIHPTVSSVRGKSQDYMCRSMVSNRKCQFYNSVEQYKKNSEFSETICDIEDMVKLGQRYETCPYYLSKELQGNVDIIFMPYNYLVDPSVRKGLTISLPGSVLIFDEAHNLEGTCSDAASFDFSDGELKSCVREVQDAIDICLRPGYGGGTNGSEGVNPEELAQLKALLLKLEESIDSVKFEDGGGLGGGGFTRDGPFIYQFFSEIGITFETHIPLVKLIDDVVATITAESAGHATIALEQFNSHLRTLYKYPLSNIDHPSNYYKVHIHSEKNKNRNFAGSGYYGKSNKTTGKEGRTLSYWCFNPGVAMQELQQAGVRSIILTSGTLSPMESFAYELKTPFPVQLENSHVIGKGQVWVGVVSKGPSGQPLNSSYQNRDSDSYKSDLGNAIVNYARIVPNGLLVFFPSYSVLTAALDFWKLPTANSATTIWERICSHKQPVVEPRESHQFSHAIDDFYQKVKDPGKESGGGAIFFAVCRGKVSEGLDFANQNGRAVIITGLPYPALDDAKIKLKREYLNNCKPSSGNMYVLRGGEWYSQQASRAVNQAVGRVIRHRSDYGAIILCDERFAQRSAQDQLSKWLRPHLKLYNQFGESTMALIQFFRNVPKIIDAIPEIKQSTDSYSTPTKQLNTTSPVSTPTPTKSITSSKPAMKDTGALIKPINTNNPSIRTRVPTDQSDKLKTEIATPLVKKAASVVKPTQSSPVGKSTNVSSTQLPIDPEQQRRRFNELAKRELSDEGYKQFHEILRELRNRSIKLHTAVMKVNELAAGNRVLIEQFIPFIPSKRQEKYRLLLLGPDGSTSTTNTNTNRDTAYNQNLNTNPTLESTTNSTNSRVITVNVSTKTSVTTTTSITSTTNTTNTTNTTTDPTNPITPANPTNSISPILLNTAPTTKRNNVEMNNLDSINEEIESPKRSTQQYDLISGLPAKKKQKVNARPALTNSATKDEQANDKEGQDVQVDNRFVTIPDPDPAPAEATTGGCTCSICRSKAVSPFSARCGHICCHGCWASWLKEKLECPVCREKTRPKQLQKLYFN